MITTLRGAAATAVERVRDAIAEGSLPGAAFGVAHVDEGVVVAEALGRADAVDGTPVTLATPFCLASTTKPIAGTVLGALLEARMVSLDDPVRRWVPELPSALFPGPEVDVRAVATHTAGLGVHHRFFYDDERPSVSVAHAVRTLARPALPVGRQWRYSNLGYGVLQLVLERASGESMASLVRRTVFSPLGMHESSWGEPCGPPGAAARHLSAGERYPGYVTDHPSASEAWCSIGDLLAFGLAHARRSLLGSNTHDLLATPSAPPQPDGAAYALGWVTREPDGVRLLIHGGRMGGVGAHLVVVPEAGLVVAGLANAETDRLAEAVGLVLSAARPGYRPPEPVPPWSVGKPPRALARRWEGVVRFGDDDLPVVLDAAADRATLAIGRTTGEVAAPHLQPDAVQGHLLATLEHDLVPSGSICHLDAVPGWLHADGFVGCDEREEEAPPDVIVGALVTAQYPSDVRRRQGDAVSGALLLRAVDG